MDDAVKNAAVRICNTIVTTEKQLDVLLVEQRSSWSPQPREHSTETAFSHTTSENTAQSFTSIQRRSKSPLGSIRNEQTRSRTHIRRSDLFSAKSLTTTDLNRPTSGVETACDIYSHSNSHETLPLMVIQKTPMSRSPTNSQASLTSTSTTMEGVLTSSSSTKPNIIKKSSKDLKWSSSNTALKRTKAKMSNTQMPTNRVETPKSQLLTAKEEVAKAAEEMIVEKLVDGRVKVTMTIDIKAPAGRIGLSGKAPNGMSIKSVLVNGITIYSGL